MIDMRHEQPRRADHSDGVCGAERDLDQLFWDALRARDAANAMAMLEAGADPNVLGAPIHEFGRTRRETALGSVFDTLGDRLRWSLGEGGDGDGDWEQLGAEIGLVVAIIDAGADPNAPGWSERPGTSLHDAASYAMPTWLRFFHAFGRGLGGAGFGALAGSLMAKLIAAGLDASAPGPQGLTPLHQAAGLGLVEVAAELLAAGASVAAQDDDGETPLHRSAKGGYLAVAEMLLEAGADPLARDSMGCSAEDVAGWFGGQAMVALFAPHCERAYLARATPEAAGPTKRARL